MGQHVTHFTTLYTCLRPDVLYSIGIINSTNINKTLLNWVSSSRFVSHLYHFVSAVSRPPGRRRQTAESDSIPAVKKRLLLLHSKHTNFNLVGVEFGRHCAAVEVELSSAWLVRVSDEPGFGTTDNCCTFTSKGEKEKERAAAAEEFILQPSPARTCFAHMTSCGRGLRNHF